MCFENKIQYNTNPERLRSGEIQSLKDSTNPFRLMLLRLADLSYADKSDIA